MRIKIAFFTIIAINGMAGIAYGLYRFAHWEAEWFRGFCGGKLVTEHWTTLICMQVLMLVLGSAGFYFIGKGVCKFVKFVYDMLDIYIFPEKKT